MSAIFTLQEEEEAEEEELSKEDKANQGKIINKKGLTGLIKVKPGVTLGNNMEIKMFFKNENRLNTIKRLVIHNSEVWPIFCDENN